MAAAVEQAMVKIKTRSGFSAPGWSCERGDEIEVPVADARRMIARGLAEAVDASDQRLKRITEEDRQINHRTIVNEILAARLGLESPAPIKR